jgi:hypothetical protein
MNRTGSELQPMMGFGISNVEPSGSAITFSNKTLYAVCEYL